MRVVIQKNGVVVELYGDVDHLPTEFTDFVRGQRHLGQRRAQDEQVTRLVQAPPPELDGLIGAAG